MDNPLSPSGVLKQEWYTQKPVYINKNFKIEDPSDHSFRKTNCLLRKCRVTALLVNLIKNLLELIQKEEQIKPRLVPYSVETVNSLESMPYLRMSSVKTRGRKARPRCMLCPAAQHSTCIPRRRVISMTPTSACCKTGNCYTPVCLPTPSNFCPYHRESPCPITLPSPCPINQSPYQQRSRNSPAKSTFPQQKRESYMHMPCDPCDRKMQFDGCGSVSRLPPPCYPRPIPCLEPMPSCYDCPTLAPCQTKDKPHALPKLSRPNLSKRLCVLNPCTKDSKKHLDCSELCTAATTTEESPVQITIYHQPCLPRHEISIQQEVNTDNTKLCISTQTSVVVLPEVRCGPSLCSAGHQKVAQTGPSRQNVVQCGPSQISTLRSQKQFSQATQIQSENFMSRVDMGEPKNCSCQVGYEPMMVSNNVCQPLATGVFIRFPDMCSNAVYGVPMAAVVASACPMGGTRQDGRPCIQDPSQQWNESMGMGQAIPARRISEETQPSTEQQSHGMSSTRMPPSSVQWKLPPSCVTQGAQRTPYDSQDSGLMAPWPKSQETSEPQGLNSPHGATDLYNSQDRKGANFSQRSNVSLGPQFKEIAQTSGPYGPQTAGQGQNSTFASEYNSQTQPEAARGAYGTQPMYTSSRGLGNTRIGYDNSYDPQSLGPGKTSGHQPASERRAMSGPQSTVFNNPYPSYGPQVQGTGAAYGQAGQSNEPITISKSDTDASDNRYSLQQQGAETGPQEVDPYGTFAPDSYGRQSIGTNDTDSRSRPIGQMAPSDTFDPQSSAYSQNFRPELQYRKKISFNKTYDQSANPSVPDQYYLKSIVPSASKTGVYDSSQNAAYGSKSVGPTIRRDSMAPSGPYIGPNSFGFSGITGPVNQGEIRGVYGPVRTTNTDESQLILPADPAHQTGAHGPTLITSFQPVPMENAGQDRIDRKSVNTSQTMGATGSKSMPMPDGQKIICQRKRNVSFSKNTLHRTEDGGQAVATKGLVCFNDPNSIASSQFQERRQPYGFDDNDAESIFQPISHGNTTNAYGSQPTGQEEQFGPKAAQNYTHGQAIMPTHDNTQETTRRTPGDPVTDGNYKTQKEVNYDAQVTAINDLRAPQPEPEETFTTPPTTHKSTIRRESNRSQLTDIATSVRWQNASDVKQTGPSNSRRQTEGPSTLQRELAAEAEALESSDEDEKSQEISKVSNNRRQSKSPIAFQENLTTGDDYNPNGAKQISSPRARHAFTKSPPSSRTSSAERTNAPITNRSTTNRTVSKIHRLNESSGQIKTRSPAVPSKVSGAVQAKKTVSNQSRGSNTPIQSRSGSPQRKVSNQSQGSVQNKQTKRKTSIKRESANKVDKSPTTASDDKKSERNANVTATQKIGLEMSLSDTKRANNDKETSTDSNTNRLCKPCPVKKKGSDLGGMMPCDKPAQDYPQLREYSSGEEGDHGTSTESITSRFDRTAEEPRKILCTKLYETYDPPEDPGPCWSQPLGSPCRPISRLHPYKCRPVDLCDVPCKEVPNTNCVTPACHRKSPSQKRPHRVTIQNRPPWQNINSGRNARRTPNSTGVQPPPPCHRIPPWPQLCPSRSKSPLSVKCQCNSPSSPSHSPCRTSSRQSTHVRASCMCIEDKNRSTVSLECRKGREKGYPCSETPTRFVESQALLNGTKDCQYHICHIASSLQMLKQDHR